MKAHTWQSSFHQAHTSTSATRTTCAGYHSLCLCLLASPCWRAHANANTAELTVSRKHERMNRSSSDDCRPTSTLDVSRWSSSQLHSWSHHCCARFLLPAIGDFTFWISLSLSPKFEQSPTLSQKWSWLFLSDLVQSKWIYMQQIG